MIPGSNSAAAAVRDEALSPAVVEAEGRHIAGLLAFVERDAHVSQRALASELGVALGLVNTYIKRCVKKGLIKVQQVPSRRYAYYLTPSGFAEKSRLTAEYLSWSLSFFRRARLQCSDLTEIAVLCAAEHGIAIVVIVDGSMRKPILFNIPVVASLEAAPARPDGAIVTGIHEAQRWCDLAVADLGASRVLAPPMLSVRTGEARS